MMWGTLVGAVLGFLLLLIVSVPYWAGGVIVLGGALIGGVAQLVYEERCSCR